MLWARLYDSSAGINYDDSSNGINHHCSVHIINDDIHTFIGPYIDAYVNADLHKFIHGSVDDWHRQ